MNRASFSWHRVIPSILLLGTAPALASSVSLDKGPVVLGRTESVGVTIRVDERAGGEGRPLRLSVNVGTFQAVTRLSPGVYRAVYIPPPTRFPQVALIAAWQETGPDAPIEFLRIPLYGMTKVDVAARPRSEVRVEVGLQEFGPVTMGASGAATVPVVVPPGVPEAIIKVREPSGAVTTKRARVDVPSYNRLTVAAVPHALLANGEDWARIEVFYDLGGADVPPDRIRIDSSAGKPVFERAERGRYVYRYQAPVGATGEVKLNVSVAGDALAKAAGSLELGLPPPEAIVINPPDKPLLSDGHSSAPVSILVFDAAGLGLPQQKIEVVANGRPLTGLTYKGNGLYQVPFVAPAAYPPGGLVQIAASVFRPGGSPLAGVANYQVLPRAVPKSVVAEVRPSPVMANGRSRAVLSLDVRDGAGLPLNEAQLVLVPSHGALGRLSPVGEGRYQAEYTAPDHVVQGGEASVRVVDVSGSFETQLAIPLRDGPSFLLGVRGGVTHSLGDLVMPRYGADAWVPLRLGDSVFGVGLSATFGTATQPVGDYAARANLIPVTLRLGYEIYASRRLTASLGLGAVAAWAQVTSNANRTPASKLGFGGMGFVGGGLNVGPGQFFAELSYAYAPLEHPDFRLNAGGAAIEGGYRFGFF